MSVLALFLSVLAIVLIAGDWGLRLVRRRDDRKRFVDLGLFTQQVMRTHLAPGLMPSLADALSSRQGSLADRVVSPNEFAVVPNPDDEIGSVFRQVADGANTSSDERWRAVYAAHPPIETCSPSVSGASRHPPE